MAVVSTPYYLGRRTSHQRQVIFAFVVLFLLNSYDAHSSSNVGSRAVNWTVTALKPSSAFELYNSASGPVQWRVGFPIPSQDTVQVTSETTGPDSIEGLEVVVDGKLLSKSISPPWVAIFPCSGLLNGGHVMKVTTLLSGRKGAFAILPINFVVVSTLPSNLVPPVVSTVKGVQQVLSQGTVATIDPISPNRNPPAVDSGSHLVTEPGVSVLFQHGSDSSVWLSGQPVVVNGFLVVKVIPASGSSVTKYVFSIYRDGNVIYSSPSPISLSGAGIKLLVKRGTSAGLNPGDVELDLWGVDSAGNFTAPTAVGFTLKDDLDSVVTKP